MKASSAINRPMSGRVVRRGLPPLLALVMLALTATSAQAATPSVFVPMKQPISLAAAKTRLLATRFCSDRVFAINQAGTISTFANLPSTGNSCIGRDIAISPGLGGFRKDYVFAVQKQVIYWIPPTGGTPVAFVTIPSLHDSDTSLSFDTVGTFGFNLIAMDRLGQVWTVTSRRVATEVTDLGHQIEGGQVAPLGFVPFGGQLLGTDDFTNSVFAVAANGTETPVVTYDTPEAVEFVPQSHCQFQNSGGALFMASQFGNVIYKFPSTDFDAIDDGLHALVLTKKGVIGLLSTNGASVSVSDFVAEPIGNEGDELEDASFFPCA
jgi:hypothetical protein